MCTVDTHCTGWNYRDDGRAKLCTEVNSDGLVWHILGIKECTRMRKHYNRYDMDELNVIEISLKFIK